MSTIPTRRIEVFAEVACPFTHYGLRRLRDARESREAHFRLVVRAWPLEWINGAPLDPALVGHEIDALREEVAPDLFKGFDPGTFPRTSIPAFGLASAAYRIDDEVGEAVSLRLRDALFEEGLDISDDDVLREIGAPFDLTPLAPHTAMDRARADWERGQARHVAGSPHFFANGRDWFCPSLRIRKVDGEFGISANASAVDDFYAAVLA
jgi:predicted DsbA family dithiol-disulfide isomerase